MEPYDFDNIFDRIDKDKSGGLDRVEVEEFFVSRGATTPDTLWKVEDKNENGIISWDEFTGPKGVDSIASKAERKRVADEIVSEEVEMDQFEEFVEGNLDAPIEEIQNEL
jgi:Ca2+-binding EF-hand superfamily protein